MRQVNRSKTSLLIAIAAATVVSAAASRAIAAAGTWNGNTSALWSTATNWTGGPPVPAETLSVVYTFGAAGSANPASQMDANWLTGRIAFVNNGFSVNQPAAGGPFTLSLGGTANGQAVNNSANVTGSAINVPIFFATGMSGGSATASRLLDVSSGGELALNASIDTNGGSVIKTGAGNLTLGAANTFASGTNFGFNTANGQSVLVGDNGAFGNATIVHNSGFGVANNAAGTTFVQSSGNANVKLSALSVANPITLTNAVSLGGTGSFGLTQSLGAFNGTSSMNLNGVVTIDTTANAGGYKIIGVESNTVATINGQIVNGSGAGGIDKGNPGVLVITNANNTYSGGVRLSNGTIRVGSDTALGTGTFTSNSSAALTTLAATAAGPRTFANDVVLGSNTTLEFGSTGFTNDITFSGATSLTGLNADTIAGNADDLKIISVFGGNQVVTLGGAITETATGYGIQKAGAGTLVLGNNNSFTGGILMTAATGLSSVSGGTVQVDGTNTSDATLGGGKLRGTGSVRFLNVTDNTADSTANGGVLSPGTDTTVATIFASRAAFNDGGSMLFNLNNALSTAGTGWDLLALNGIDTPNADIDVGAGTGGFKINITGPGTGFDPNVSQSFVFVTASGVTNFLPSDFAIDTTGFVPTLNGSFGVQQSGSNLSLVYTAVPEPTAIASLALAGLGLLVRRRSAPASEL